MAQALPYNSKFIPRIKWKEMQHNHGVGWEIVLITIKKLKMSEVTKKCGPGRTPGLGWSEESRRFMNELNSEVLSPSSASGYVGYLWGCVRLWSSTFFESFCNNLLYYIDVCIWNDRTTPPSQDALPVSLELLLDLMKSFQLIRWILVKSWISHLFNVIHWYFSMLISDGRCSFVWSTALNHQLPVKM